MASSVVKARYWVFITYPESLPDDWQSILQQTGCPIAVSPLHNMDVYDNGEIKKAHYHNLICYAGPTTFKNVKRLTDRLNAPIPEASGNVKGSYLYFTHRNNPEKFQYSESDILCLNGFVVSDYFSLTSSEEDAMYSFIEDFIQDRGIFELWSLFSVLKSEGLIDYLSFLRRHTVYFNALLRSRFNIRKVQQEQDQKEDKP